MVARGWGRRTREQFNGYEVSVLQDEKSEDVWFYNNVNARKTTELYNET